MIRLIMNYKSFDVKNSQVSSEELLEIILIDLLSIQIGFISWSQSQLPLKSRLLGLVVKASVQRPSDRVMAPYDQAVPS